MLLTYLALTVLITTILCELAAKREWLPYWVSRKILHIIAVGACAIAGYYADSLVHRELLIWIVAGAEILLLGLIGLGGLMREESGRKPWGIVWFPLAFLVLLLVIDQARMIGFCMAVLAICDPAATIAGKLFAGIKMADTDVLEARVLVEEKPFFSWITQPYNLTGDLKTIIGSLAFLGTFTLLSFLFPASSLYNPNLNAGTSWFLSYLFIILMVGTLITAGEALGSKGSDNLIIPLLTAFLYPLIFDARGSEEIAFYVGTALLLATFFSYLTIRHRSLSPGGAVAASLLGILVVLSTGPIWLLPLFLFFGSSSLIGKLFPSKSAAGDAKQKQPRDAIQVLANGGVYVAIAILSARFIYTNPIWEFRETLLLTAAAVATADTWSSEIGQYFQRSTWDLVKWRRVPAGLSGGVSWPGTLAGLAGAAFIALCGLWLLPYAPGKNSLLVIGLGFGGMLIDSILGSLFQATYRDSETGRLSDVCTPGGELISGFGWMTNDLVNFLAILITVILSSFAPVF